MEGTLQATRFIDAENPAVLAFAAAHAGHGDDVSRAVNLYYALRDAVSYDMRTFGLDPGQFVASNVLRSKAAFCVPKAVALAALARAVGIPSRIGFADVRNHLASPKLLALMDDDIFHWHAYTSLYVDGKWVKATPAFDIGLCNRHGVAALDFNGREDSIFQPFDQEGRPHMEYVDFVGEFDDMPYDGFADAMRTYHPRLLDALAKEGARVGRPDH